jgi:BCD family chlorophyll transporter-like MFS transporter
VGAVLLTMLALRGLEGTAATLAQPADSREGPQQGFSAALRQVWSEPVARQFTIFVFISMLAYSAQDLILEPFAGTVFGFTPGASTSLFGVQHGGVLVGMLLVAGAGALSTRFGHIAVFGLLGSLRGWTIAGCLASALALLGLSAAGVLGHGWPLLATVFALGVANGAFSVAAIGSMMRLASEGRQAREGVRMGLWGAAQAIAFGLGGLLGTAASDLARLLIASPGLAYASVFFLEAWMFVISAGLAWRLETPAARATARQRPQIMQPAGDGLVARMEHR